MRLANLKLFGRHIEKFEAFAWVAAWTEHQTRTMKDQRMSDLSLRSDITRGAARISHRGRSARRFS